MVYISEIAKEKIIDLMKEEGFSEINSFVRIGVKSGGCSGLSYDISFDKKKGNNDKLFETKGIKILIDDNDFCYLEGITLEYNGGLKGKGFYFNNPNAKRTCGCGESFSS